MIVTPAVWASIN